MSRRAPCSAGMRPRRGQSRGQALVEVLVALLVLVPLWFGILMVARWHDLQQTTIAAARHAAFESWVAAGHEDAAAVRETTRQRLFTDDPRRFAAAAARTTRSLGDLPQWRDPQGAALIAAAGPQVEIGPVAQPPRVEDAEHLAFAMIAPARAVGGPPFDLQRHAARGATVSVPVVHAATLPRPFAGLRFSLVERLELLVDPWAARDPGEVARRTAALSPAGALRELSRPLEPLRWAASLFEPAFERFCPGRIEPEIVPEDRLRGGRQSPPDLRQRPC